MLLSSGCHAIGVDLEGRETMRTSRYKKTAMVKCTLQLFPLSLGCNPQQLDRSIGKPLIALIYTSL